MNQVTVSWCVIVYLCCSSSYGAGFLAIIPWCSSGDSPFDFEIYLGHVWARDQRQGKVRLTIFNDPTIQNIDISCDIASQGR